MSDINYLTYQNLRDILENNDYVLLRYPFGTQAAYNCRIRKTKKIKAGFNMPGNLKSPFVSFRPCTFQEYISKNGRVYE